MKLSLSSRKEIDFEETSLVKKTDHCIWQILPPAKLVVELGPVKACITLRSQSKLVVNKSYDKA